jgi:GTPase SAR1 family protein
MEEVNDKARYAPILLVGTKSDLRKDKNINQNCLINQNEAQLMAENSGALKYLECSSYSTVCLAMF